MLRLLSLAYKVHHKIQAKAKDEILPAINPMHLQMSHQHLPRIPCVWGKPPGTKPISAVFSCCCRLQNNENQVMRHPDLSKDSELTLINPMPCLSVT